MPEDERTEGESAEQSAGQVEQPQYFTKDEVSTLVEQKLTEQNSKFQKQLNAIKKEKEEAEQRAEDSEKTAQQKVEERVSAVQAEVENWKSQATQEKLRREAHERATQAGLTLDDADARIIQRLIDPDAENPLEDVDAWIQREQQKTESIRTQTAEEFAKKHGRKVSPPDRNADAGVLSLDEIREKSKDPQWVEQNEDLINRSLEAARG